MITSQITIFEVYDGATGPQGTSVSKVVTEYTKSSSSTSLPSSPTWSETKPSISAGEYLWKRERTDLNNNTSTYGSATCDVIISGIVSDVDQVNQKITNKVWQTDINTSISTYDGSTVSAMRDRITSVEQGVSGITSTVADIQSDITTETNQRKAIYGTSNTTGSTAAKVVSCSNFELYPGVAISVKFDNANTASAPTLNVNNTGAKTVKTYTGGTLSEGEYKWAAGGIYDFIYDGTNWRLVDSGSLKRITAAESSITQNADNIELKVSKNEVISSINQSAESITISANKIDLQGNVTFSSFDNATQLKINGGIKASTQLWITKADSTTPSVPSSHVTNTSTSGNVWTTVVPTYNASYPYYFYCYEYQLLDGSYIYSSVVYDRATSETQERARTAITNAATAQSTAENVQTNISDAMGGYTILWNYENFTAANSGEGYICKLDPLTGTASDDNGWIKWNGVKRTITKGMINPNAILPYNIPIYIVCRLSSDSAITGTNYMVWYNSGWKYAVTPTPSAVESTAWTWSSTRDIIIGKFVEPSSEGQFTDCVIYNPPLTAKHITTDTVTARSADTKAALAQTTANSAVRTTVSCYYRSTTNSTPSISASTSIGTSNNTDNTWSYVMPLPKKNCFFFTCEEYVPVSGTKSYSTVRALDNQTYVSKWVSSTDNTYIDGGSIYTHSINTAQLATDAIKSNNYSAGPANSPYSSIGSFLDLTNGNFYTPNFGIDNVYGKAYLNGEIIAVSGTIGDDSGNYWEIGDTTDSQGDTSAAIVAHGTAYIQNGDWQFSDGAENYTNGSINTQWYVTPSGGGLEITHPHYDNKYWDYGMTSPILDTTSSKYYNATVSQNFLYIRKSPTNAIPSLESDWNYIFRVDKDGVVYASNLYVNGHSIASMITDGVEGGAYLSTSGGTVSGNVTITGTLTATATKANALSTSGTIRTNLGSTSTATYTSGGNITPGVTGTLGVGNGGTGQTSAKNAANAFLAALDVGTGEFTDSTYFITNNNSGATTDYYRRSVTKLWDYIKSKITTDSTIPYVLKSGDTITGSLTVENGITSDVGNFDEVIATVGRFTNGLYGELTGNVIGTASSASKFSSNRTITLTGDTTGSVSGDGSSGWSIATTTKAITNTGGTTVLSTQQAIDDFISAYKLQYGLFKTSEQNNVGMASNDGMLISMSWGQTTYGAQLAFDDVTSGVMKFRGKSTNWGDWRTVIHDGNYTSYTVKKDGTGASGTWGISISGNATTATSATKATNDSDGNAINTTYLKKSGGTMTGKLTLLASQYSDAYNSGALDLQNSNIDGVNSIYMADLSDSSAEGIHFYRDSTHVDSIWVKNGNFYFTPNRSIGGTATDYTVYHTGNKPTASDVGLGNVTNNAQVKKISSSTNNNLVSWGGTDGATVADSGIAKGSVTTKIKLSGTDYSASSNTITITKANLQSAVQDTSYVLMTSAERTKLDSIAVAEGGTIDFSGVTASAPLTATVDSTTKAVNLTHNTSGATAGTYRSVTVNTYGHVTAGTNPTTLSGYGITDAKIASGVITLGSNTITPLTASSTLDATKLSGTASISTTGNATTATKFSSSRSIALTGDVTGSASSTGESGWSIATTIGSSKVTNAMLAGSIANNKLANSSITIGDTAVSLGGSITATTGPFRIHTNGNADKAFSIVRSGDNESVKHWVDDSIYHIDYTNDEASSQIKIKVINTDTESGGGANASEYIYTFTSTGTISGANFTGTAAKATADGSGNTITTTYVKKAGDSMTGSLVIETDNSYSSYNEGLRINKGVRGYSTLLLGGTSGTTSGTNAGAWWIGVNNNSYTRRLMIAHNGSGDTGTYFYTSADSTVTPNLRLGGSGTITSGNMDAVNGGTVYTALGDYCTLSTNQTISGVKTFSSMPKFNTGITVSNASGTAGGIGLYDSTITSYGIAFRGTSNGGKHGYVQGDWATYNYMQGNNDTDIIGRGWIWKNAYYNRGVASISAMGHASFEGSVTVGGNASNNSGCRLEYDSNLKSLNFVFN